MKRLISLILILTMVVICGACATTGGPRTDKEGDTLSGSLGKSTFVGESGQHTNDVSLGLMYGH